MKMNTTEPDINRIVREYGDSLYRMAFLYLNDVHLAQDAVQDTLLKLYTTKSPFQGGSSEKTWIMRILINTCKNYRRTNWWRRTDVLSAIEQVPINDPEPAGDELITHIMRLRPKYKEVILLYYYQELKIREIAKVLHCPESTVSVRLKRARESLKSMLKEEFSE